MSCVIGVPDPLKMQKVKAFIMLKPGVPADQNTKDTLMAYAKKNIAKYALPYDIEFRSELPKTLVGKVAYRVLEEEELARQQAQASETPDLTPCQRGPFHYGPRFLSVPAGDGSSPLVLRRILW